MKFCGSRDDTGKFMTEISRDNADEAMMNEALRLAREAAMAGEVPVGAVVVKNGSIIGRGRNRTEELKNPMAHAEMSAMQDAVQNTDGFRLTDCDLYVTLEPCSMCAGAIVHCRIQRLIIGASDPKTGACGSVLNITEHPALNHHPSIKSGVLEKECSEILRDFFRQKREEHRFKRLADTATAKKERSR